ncbi:MAG: phytoene/squalene synthase family protein [Burkholderiaceae bacterium]
MPGSPPFDPADLAACRALLRRHARSFHAASRLLPGAVCESASVLYAFCRVADDAVDVEGGRHATIAHLRRRLDAACQGAPLPSPVDRAFAVLLAHHDMPRLLPERLIDGLAWDAEGRPVHSLDELLDYASRVAGTVGAMMAVLMGARSPQALARACDLGVAMQLSNIARDVAEDARMGRLYLPRDWLREAGIDPDAWLANPVYSAALGQVLRRLVGEARVLYARAASGIALLPWACRPGINAARLLYAEIGHAVLRAGPRALQRRTVVPARRRAWLLARAAATPWPVGAGRGLPPLAANQALVTAAQRAQPAAGGIGFVVELFSRLERQDRPAALAPGRKVAS